MKETFPTGVSKPEIEKCPELRFANLAPETWKALWDVKRTDWIRRGVANPESVQEHIISLRQLAWSLEGLSEEERDGLLDMLEIHDWPEAIHGDEVTAGYEAEEKKRREEIKFEKEHAALTQICTPLGEKGEEIMRLWLRFESSDDVAAVIARQLDKYQAVEKSLEYEKTQGIPLFEEFSQYASRYITHPILKQKLNELQQEWDLKA